MRTCESPQIFETKSSPLFAQIKVQQHDILAHSTLTAAERKVVAAVVRHKGSPNKVVAAFLHLSEHTLRNHLASIYSKLGIHRRVDLVLYGIEHKLGTLAS
jgi:DNA-binding NarL/FixJ family response regulator